MIVVETAVVLRVLSQIFEVDRFLVIGDESLHLYQSKSSC